MSRRRCWIVIGYSGENDPVFKRLSAAEVFHNKLFWVGYRDEEPARHVLEGILQPSEKYGIAGAQKEAIDSDELIRKTREIWLSEKIDEIDALYETVKQSEIEAARQNLAYALYNWGNALGKLAELKEGQEAEDLCKEAFEKLGEAEKIKEGVGAYNLACAYSLKGDIEESLRWLEKSLKLDTAPAREHIEQDTDLELIKKNPRFNQLIDRYFKNP